MVNGISQQKPLLPILKTNIKEKLPPLLNLQVQEQQNDFVLPLLIGNTAVFLGQIEIGASALLASTAMAYRQGFINKQGLQALTIFTTVCMLSCNEDPHLALFGHCMRLVMGKALLSGQIPGFKPWYWFHRLRLRPHAQRCSCSVSINKHLVGGMLLLCYRLQSAQPLPDSNQLLKASCLSAAVIGLWLVALQQSGLCCIERQRFAYRLSAPWQIHNTMLTCLSEEVFFRGMLQVDLEHLFGNVWIAVLLSAITCACCHFPKNDLRYAIFTGLCAMAYSSASIITGRLEGAIVLHALCNFIHFNFLTYPKRHKTAKKVSFAPQTKES